MGKPSDAPPVVVRPGDLAVSCPNPAMPLWSSHPRVFLEFEKDGTVRCPYCSIMIKENHIAAAGGVAAALIAAQRVAPTGVLIEIEVETLAQLDPALAAGATRILLDNFDLDGLRTAVRATAGRAELEASGGMALANVRAVAETGVDYISVGGLTKHVEAVDLSLWIHRI